MSAPWRVDRRLDIAGIVIPFSLARCKCTLAGMDAGAVLEVSLQDRDTLEDLLVILERSGDHVLSWEKHGERYYLWVRKGPRGNLPPGCGPGSAC